MSDLPLEPVQSARAAPALDYKEIGILVRSLTVFFEDSFRNSSSFVKYLKHSQPARDKGIELVNYMHQMLRSGLSTFIKKIFLPENAFYQMLQNAQFEWDSETLGTLKDHLAMLKAGLADFGEEAFGKTIEALNTFETQTNLAALWEVFEAYKADHRAFCRNLAVDDQHTPEPYKTVLDLNDNIMEALVASFVGCINRLPSYSVSLEGPDGTRFRLENMPARAKNSHESNILKILAFSAGAGMVSKEVPDSLQSHILAANGETRSIISAFIEFRDEIVNGLKRHYPQLSEADCDAILVNNRLKIGEQQSSALVQKMREALPDLMAHQIRDKSRSKSAWADVIKDIAALAGETLPERSTYPLHANSRG